MRRTVYLLPLVVAPGLATTLEGSLPSFFFPNTGQMGPRIRYVLQTPDLRVGFASDCAIFRSHSMQMRLRFTGANPKVVIEGVEPQSARVSFFRGRNAKGWQPGVTTYRRIKYRDLYPGIDLSYAAAGRRIKSEFVVRPGADPAQIRLVYQGANRISVGAGGDLIVSVRRSELREEAPEIYQDLDRGRVQLNGRYRLLGPRTVGFEIDGYDPFKPLVIDPSVSYSTYLGGSAMSAVTGVAADGSGNLYVAGWTEALDFPIAGAVQASNQGGVDVFVAKVNASGTALVYATYIGGRGEDRATGIAVDSLGQAYVTGSTSSTNFPLASPIRSTLGGGRDAFALKLNSAGNTLLYSTYLGGTNYDVGTAIAVDGSGNAYIAGDTLSANFPVLNAVQAALAGGRDAFITKLTPAGAISLSTYLGGGGDDHAGGIALDANGNVYIAGGTFSTNFPLAGAIQGSNGGSQDVFVTKLNAGGSALVYSTYLGGSGGEAGTPQQGMLEQANAISVDAVGTAYVTGVTNSADFPVTPGALRTSFNGTQDAFAVKIKPAGDALVYGTYIGGTSFNWASGIAAGLGGNAYIAGYTSSSDFPLATPVQPAFAGLYDAFFSEINAAGSSLICSTFYGGAGSDVANAIALGSSGDVFMGGQTNSFDFPLQRPIQSTNLGGGTGWVLRLTAVCAFVLSSTGSSPSSQAGTGTLTVTASDPSCSYAATSNVPWLSITGGAIGTGNGTVSYSYTTNISPNARTGTLTIAGQTFTVIQPGAATTAMSLSRTSLNFGVSGALVTDPQSITVTLSGGLGASWTVSSSQSNITVSPSSGTGDGIFQVTATAGASGVISVTASGATNSPQQVQVNVANVAPGSPYGSFDTPVDNTAGIAGEIAVTGWALDNVEVSKVDIWRERIGSEPVASNGLVYIGDGVFVAGARPDVETAYPNAPFNYRAGWGYLMLTTGLPNNGGSPGPGNGTYKLHAIAHNKAGVAVDLGTRAITVDNAHATKPFGTIDTPGQGATVSGTVINFGWALTQQPYVIPTDGSTIWVTVDGQVLGHPVYNQYRSDIATGFPGLANSNGAVGYFVLDTTTLTNGVHNIGWLVYDNAGRGDGVGSRFFTVLNSVPH